MSVVFSLQLDASSIVNSAKSASDALEKVAYSAETARKTVGQVNGGASKALGDVSVEAAKVSTHLHTAQRSLASAATGMNVFISEAKGLSYVESTLGAVNKQINPTIPLEYGKNLQSVVATTKDLTAFTKETSSLEAKLYYARNDHWAKRKEQLLEELGYVEGHINATALRAAAEERVRMERLQQEGESTQSFGKLWEETYKRVDEAGAGMIESLLTGSKNGLDSLKGMFTRTVAEMANAMVLRPITVSVMGVMGGVLGGAFGSTGSAIGTAQAGQVGGGAGNFGMPNVPVSSFLPESWTSGISGFMGAPLPGTSIPGLMGPTPTGAALSGGFGLGSALGYGGMGGLGYSLLGGALGLPQNKFSGITSSVGGSLGAWGGSALGTAMGASGAISGAMAGSAVFPVVGTILGALGGGLLSGLFGSERKTKPSVYTRVGDLGIDSGYDYEAAFRGGAWYDRAGSKEADVVMPVLGEAAKVAAQQVEALVAALPEEFSGQVQKELDAATFDAGRGVAGMDKGNWNFQFYDEEQLKERLEAAVKDIQIAMGKAAEEALGKVDMSGLGLTLDTGTLDGLAKATQALEALKNVTDTIENSLNPLSEYDQAQKNIHAQMDQWVNSLRELGFTQEKVAEVEQKRTALLEAALGTMRLAFEQDARLRLAQIGGNANFISSTQMAIQHERELADIRSKFGADSLQYEQTLMVQQAERQLLEIEHQRQTILAAQQAVAAAEAAYQQALSATQSAAQAWVSAAESTSKQAQSAYEAEVKSIVDANKRLVDSLRNLRKDLYMDERLNPQGSSGALATAQSEFDRLYKLGMAGDADAANQLGGVAKNLASLLYGSSVDFGSYEDAFYDISKKLADVENEARNRADAAQKQLDALLNIESTGKKTLDQLMADMQAAQEQYDEAMSTTKRYYSAWGLDQLNPGISGLKTQFFNSLKGLESAEASLNGALQAAIEFTGGNTVGSLDQLRSEAQYGLERQLNLLKMIELAIREMAISGSSSADFQQLVLQAKAYDLNSGKWAEYSYKKDWTPADILSALAKMGVTFDQWYQQYGKNEGYLGVQLPSHPGISGGGSTGGGSIGGGSSGGGTTPPKPQPPQPGFAGSKYPTEYALVQAKTAALNRQGYEGRTNWGVSEVWSIINGWGGVAYWYDNFGRAEGFAKGGLAPAGWAMVGEEGPELVNFSRPGRVYTAEDTADMFRAATRPAQGGGSDMSGEIRAMRQEIRELRRENASMQRQLIKAVNLVAKYTSRTSDCIEEIMDEGAGKASLRVQQ